MAEDKNTPPPASPPDAEPKPPPSSQPPEVKPSKLKVSKPVLIIGGIFLLLVVTALSLVFIKQPQPGAPLASPMVEASPQVLTLELASPAEGELAINNEILVSGSTSPNTVVVAYTETDETSLESDTNGNFETTISLIDGINSLVVTAFADDGQEKTASVDVVYDSEPE